MWQSHLGLHLPGSCIPHTESWQLLSLWSAHSPGGLSYALLPEVGKSLYIRNIYGEINTFRKKEKKSESIFNKNPGELEEMRNGSFCFESAALRQKLVKSFLRISTNGREAIPFFPLSIKCWALRLPPPGGQIIWNAGIYEGISFCSNLTMENVPVHIVLKVSVSNTFSVDSFTKI